MCQNEASGSASWIAVDAALIALTTSADANIRYLAAGLIISTVIVAASGKRAGRAWAATRECAPAAGHAG
jgi:hypothetical protein